MEIKLRLNELMQENDVSVDEVFKYLNYKNKSNFYRWKNNKTLPKMDTVFKLSNYFKCNIEYLIGRTENFEALAEIPMPKFSAQIEKIIKEKKVTHYRLIKDKIITSGNEYSLFYLNCTPTIETIIKIADYLGVSVDYLVGRV